MSDAFPTISTISLKEAEPGSIIKIGRPGGPKLALVTNHLTNGARCFVWLNPKFQKRPSAIFAENWQNDAAVLQFGRNIRFEVGISDDDLEPNGGNFWDTPGVIVSIKDELFIRAAPQDEFRGTEKLVNIRDGSVYSEHLTSRSWTFLSWQVWIRDSVAHRDLMLTEFRARDLA